MKINYIFFDFDGVLAESVEVKTEAFRQMYLQYGVDFANRVVEHHKNNGGISRFEKFKIYNGQWLNENIDDRKIEELASKFSELALQGVVNADEVTGAVDFLSLTVSITKFIITGTPTLEIISILEARKWDHFFKAIYGSPEKKDFCVKKLMSEYNIKKEECVFIGDALADYDAAQKNDITFILRETTIGESLFKDFKGYRIKDISELASVIHQIESSI